MWLHPWSLVIWSVVACRGASSSFLFFLPCCVPHVGSQFLNQGSTPRLLPWKHKVLTTGQPGKSPGVVFKGPSRGASHPLQAWVPWPGPPSGSQVPGGSSRMRHCPGLALLALGTHHGLSSTSERVCAVCEHTSSSVRSGLPPSQGWMCTVGNGEGTVCSSRGRGTSSLVLCSR